MSNKAKKTKKNKNKKLDNNTNIVPEAGNNVNNTNNSINIDINNIVIEGNPYKIGDIILALSGRDEDRLFAVVGILDKDYVLIANGRSRRVDSPKKKKIKHIKLLKESGSNFAEKAEKSKSGRLTNLILRNVINDYVQRQIAESQKSQENRNSLNNKDNKDKQDDKEAAN